MKLKLNNNPKIGLGIFPGTPLEYIKTSDTQWIDTGIYGGNSNLSFEFKFKYEAWYQWNFLFSSRTQNNSTTDFCIGGSTDDNSAISTVNSTTNGTIKYPNVCTKNTWHTVSFNQMTATFDNVIFNRTAAPPAPTGDTRNIYLFYNLHNISKDRISLAYMKIYNNGILVRDFIPCKDTNGVVCLYDTVSEIFFYNSGTGNFIAGPETQVVEYTSVSDRFKLKCTDLFLKDCPNVNNIRLLKAILDTSGNTLSRIRISVNNDVFTLSQAQQLLSMNGFNDNMQEQVKPRIVGSITINDYLTQEILTQLQNTLDGCTITAPNLIDFNDLAVQTLDSTKPNYNPAAAIVFNNNGKGTVINPVIEDGGRYFLTKTQAAAITTISTMFMDKASVTDSNGIVSADKTITYNFTSLNELQYFTGLTQLNGYAFRSCSNLTSIIIPDRVTTISSIRCFFGCTSLTNVTLPDTLTTIGDSAFQGCTNLLLEELPESVTTLGGSAFSNCSKISLTQLPSGITVLAGVFSDCTNLALTSLPPGLTSIGNYEFRNTKITITELPATVTSIGTRAFQNCSLIPYLHMLSDTPCTISTGSNSPFYGSSFKLYVGDGSSADHDNAILQTYLANTNWAALSSRLDTWYNHEHSNQ